jgi:type IV secretory pathway component VirB8
MLSKIKQKIKSILGIDETMEFRLIKKVENDPVLLDIIIYYYVEKREGMNWYTVTPKFINDLDSCLKYFAKYREYIKNKQVEITYLNEK